MTPQLGTKIYVIETTNVLRYVDVHAIGKESFIIRPTDNVPLIHDECRFDEYDHKWFINLASAKKCILEKNKGKMCHLKLEQVTPSTYMLVRKINEVKE